MLTILDYTLPDVALIDIQADSTAWKIWKPEQLLIVLGQSNKAERSLFVDRVIEDQIPVYQRPSGGETVILSQKTLIISVRLLSERLENPQVYFKRINTLIIAALEGLGVKEVHYKGISDISIGEKKILGSSIYRKKKLVFYHAVLNIAEDIELISRYLQHPPKEPDYRKGRDHKDFVTSLAASGCNISPDAIATALEQEFSNLL